MTVKYYPEPFRIKAVETLKVLSKEERLEAIKRANYNTFALKSDEVYIDLLTDSGSGAMSDNQWAGIVKGDEAYAGARGLYNLLDSAEDIFGFKYFQPVHQGRAAEKVLLPIFLEKGKVAISNMHFDTTRAHVELAGARAIDNVIDAAKDTTTYHPFKGNMDIEKLVDLIEEYGKENVGCIIMTITNNSAGGQPVSMKNMRETSEIARRYEIPLIIDAARYAENAFFVREREEGYENKSPKEITREMFDYADAFTMSSKKDAIVNIGGLIGIKNDEKLFEKVKARTIPYEGFISYGGLAGRDLEALAIGLQEGIDLEYLKYRIGQMNYLGGKLEEHGIPFQSPPGGHGIFVDAQKMFPHIPYNEFPGQVLVVELYKEAGIRTCDIGSYMLGNDPDTKEQLKANNEFTRLAIPRRVYTQAHLDVIVDALVNIKDKSSEIERGYEITWEPEVLRHFTAKLKPIK